MRWLLLALLLTPSAAADPLALQVFSGVDRQAVAVGEEVLLTVDVLAVPETPSARAALTTALRQWRPALGAGLVLAAHQDEVVREAEGVLWLRRHLLLAVREGATEVPGLVFEVEAEGRRWRARTAPHPLAVYARSEAVDRAARSVVRVTAEGELAGQPFERTGTAFAVGDGRLATAFHVVVGARRVRVHLPDGTEAVTDRVWALDPERDVAVLALDADLAPLPLAPADAPGRVAFTVGAAGPVAARRFPDLDRQGVRVAGNAIAPGASGGPLLDGRGRVLGVVVAGRGDGPDPDVLRDAICLATDPGPALRRARAAAPRRLAAALAEASASSVAQVHHAVGSLELASGAASASVQRLRDAARQSNDGAVLFLAGAALEQAEDGEASAVLAASLAGGYEPAGYALGHLWMAQHRPAEALRAYRALAPDGAYGRLAALGQAEALVALGRYAEAEAPLQAVLAHDAGFAPALYLLGLVRLSQGREAEARALVVRLAERPEWAQALRVPVEAEALRPATLVALPRVATR